MEVHQKENHWSLHASCAANAMERSGLEELLENFALTIVELVSHPGKKVLPADFHPLEISVSEHPPSAKVQEEQQTEWNEQALIIRQILSRFAKMPEELIKPLSTLASMGIDSISALQISALARKQGIPITAPEVIQSNTVHELLDKISEDIPDLPLEDVEIKSPLADVILTTLPRPLRNLVSQTYPATPGMEWMIGAWQRSGGVRFQHAFVRKFSGKLDMPRMDKAWAALLAKHPILRTTFVPISRSSGRLALCILNAPHPTLKLRKLSQKGSELDALKDEARASVNHPPRAPGIHSRLTVLEGKRDTFLIINLHHFQYGEYANALSKALVKGDF